MSFTLSVNETISLNGNSIISRGSVTADGCLAKGISVPAAKVGQLTTRTDANTGVLTMVSGHGFATSDKLDVYWSGGRRLGMDATVATNAVTVDGGAGDDLPTNLTNVTAMVPVEEALAIDGDDIVGIEVYSDVSGHINIADASDASLLAKELGGSANDSVKAYVWYATRDPVNPLAGEAVAKVFFSHGDSSKAANMRVSYLVN